jgi:uncharacterized protein DUF6167
MRVVWFAAGTVAGVYVTAKARRAVEALTVEGVHDRLTGWFAGARVLREEMVAGMAEKETELRSRLVAVSEPALTPGARPPAIVGGPRPGETPRGGGPAALNREARQPRKRQTEDERPGVQPEGRRDRHGEKDEG